jgi:hypothetical protein
MENPEGNIREFKPLPTNPVIKEEKEDKLSVFQISIIFILALALIGAGIFINQNKFKSDVVCEAPNVTQTCPTQINNLTCEKQVCSCPQVNVSCNFPNNISINVKNSS